MKAKLVVQVRLRSGTAERTCFIDNAKVRVGSKVTLKNSEDPKRRWEVTWKDDHLKEPGSIHADWHAGGL